MQSDNIVNNYTTTIITIFQEVVKSYEAAIETVKSAEEELNDIYHEAEFAQPKDMYNGYLIYKDIRDIRNKRRQAKERIELLKDFYEFIKSQQGMSVKSTIQKIQGNSVKIKNSQDSRTYSPRVRNNLTIEGKTNNNKSFEQMLKDFKDTKITITNGKYRK